MIFLAALKEVGHPKSPNFVNLTVSSEILYLADDDAYILDQFGQYPGSFPLASSRSPTKALRRKLASETQDNADSKQMVATEVKEILENQMKTYGQSPERSSIRPESFVSLGGGATDRFPQSGPPSSEEIIESAQQSPRLKSYPILAPSVDTQLKLISPLDIANDEYPYKDPNYCIEMPKNQGDVDSVEDIQEGRSPLLSKWLNPNKNREEDNLLNQGEKLKTIREEFTFQTQFGSNQVTFQPTDYNALENSPSNLQKKTDLLTPPLIQVNNSKPSQETEHLQSTEPNFYLNYDQSNQDSLTKKKRDIDENNKTPAKGDLHYPNQQNTPGADTQAATRPTRKSGTIKSNRDPFDYLRGVGLAESVSSFSPLALKTDNDIEPKDKNELNLDQEPRHPDFAPGDDTKKSIPVEKLGPWDNNQTPSKIRRNLPYPKDQGPAIEENKANIHTDKRIPPFSGSQTAPDDPLSDFETKFGKFLDAKNFTDPNGSPATKRSIGISDNDDAGVMPYESKFEDELSPNISLKQNSSLQIPEERLNKTSTKLADTNDRSAAEKFHIRQTFGVSAQERWNSERDSDTEGHLKQTDNNFVGKILQNVNLERKPVDQIHPEEKYVMDQMKKISTEIPQSSEAIQPDGLPKDSIESPNKSDRVIPSTKRIQTEESYESPMRQIPFGAQGKEDHESERGTLQTHRERISQPEKNYDYPSPSGRVEDPYLAHFNPNKYLENVEPHNIRDRLSPEIGSYYDADLRNHGGDKSLGNQSQRIANYTPSKFVEPEISLSHSKPVSMEKPERIAQSQQDNPMPEPISNFDFFKQPTSTRTRPNVSPFESSGYEQFVNEVVKKNSLDPRNSQHKKIPKTSKKDCTSYLVPQARPRKQSKARKEISRFGVPKDVGVLTPEQLLDMEEFDETLLDGNDEIDPHETKVRGPVTEASVRCFNNYTTLSKNNKIPNKPVAGLRVDPVVLMYHPGVRSENPAKQKKIASMKTQAVQNYQPKEIHLPEEQAERPFQEKITKSPSKSFNYAPKRQSSTMDRYAAPTDLDWNNEKNRRRRELFDKSENRDQVPPLDGWPNESVSKVKQNEQVNSTAPSLPYQRSFDYGSSNNHLNKPSSQKRFDSGKQSGNWISQSVVSNQPAQSFPSYYYYEGDEDDSSPPSFIPKAYESNPMNQSELKRLKLSSRLLEVNDPIIEETDRTNPNSDRISPYTKELLGTPAKTSQTPQFTSRQEPGGFEPRRSKQTQKLEIPRGRSQSPNYRLEPSHSGYSGPDQQGTECSDLENTGDAYKSNSPTYRDQITRSKINFADLLTYPDPDYLREGPQQHGYFREKHLRKTIGQPPRLSPSLQIGEQIESLKQSKVPLQSSWHKISRQELDKLYDKAHHEFVGRVPIEALDVSSFQLNKNVPLRTVTQSKSTRKNPVDEQKTEYEKFFDKIEDMNAQFEYVLQSNKVQEKENTPEKPRNSAVKKKYAHNWGDLIKSLISGEDAGEESNSPINQKPPLGTHRSNQGSNQELALESYYHEKKTKPTNTQVNREANNKSQYSKPNQATTQEINWEETSPSEKIDSPYQQHPTRKAAKDSFNNLSTKTPVIFKERQGKRTDSSKIENDQRGRENSPVRSTTSKQRVSEPNSSIPEQDLSYTVPTGYLQKVLGPNSVETSPTLQGRKIDDFLLIPLHRLDQEPPQQSSQAMRNSRTPDRFQDQSAQAEQIPHRLSSSSKEYSKTNKSPNMSREYREPSPKVNQNEEFAIPSRPIKEILKGGQLSEIIFNPTENLKGSRFDAYIIQNDSTHQELQFTESASEFEAKRQLLSNKHIGKYINVNKKPFLTLKYSLSSK
mgnify:FL=1